MSELFPELDAAAKGQVRVASPPKPQPSGDTQQSNSNDIHQEFEARISRGGLAAGVEAVTRFEQAFGLPGTIRSLKKTTGDEIEIVFELPDGKLATGLLVPPGVNAWRQGKSFGVSYRGGRPLPPPVAKGMLRFLARYDGVPFERVLAQVIPDSGDEHMLTADYPESVFYAFAPASGWRRFFEGVDLYRGACASHTGNVEVIDHTDIECKFNNAPYDNRLPSVFNIPEAEQDPSDDDDRNHHIHDLFTDVQDRDVIRGADKLLDQALESLAEHPQKPGMVFIQSGCLADVTGDDLEASVARAAAKLRLPVVVVGNQNDPISTALSKLFDDREITRERPLTPESVALVGIPDFTGRRSLDGLLVRAGIRVLVSVLPNLDRHAIELLAQAPVLVGYPWSRHRETARRLAARLAPARMIDPGVPFGLEGTASWLRQIGDAVGRRDAVEELIAVELAEIEPGWRALSDRARHYRVGFVIDQPNWRSALDPSRSEPETVLWYSEMQYERRLTRTGNNPFSLRQFRMGLRGALESLQELVRRAELPFYRRYGDYLGPAFAEMREYG